MIVEELVEQGANVRVTFHRCKNLLGAYEKLKPFKHLGEISRGNNNGAYWLEIENGNIKITAFYTNQTKK